MKSIVNGYIDKRITFAICKCTCICLNKTTYSNKTILWFFAKTPLTPRKNSSRKRKRELLPQNHKLSN